MKKHMDDCTEPELRDKFRQAMKWLENHLPLGDGPRKQPLIVLLASGTWAGGIAQYAANGERADIIQLLRETADRLENKEDVPR